MLIEHNMSLVMSCCDRVVVLNFGEVIADGPAAAVQADVRVMEVYLVAKPLLSLRRVDVHYGRVQALRDINLDVAAGKVVALLGANGGGKSTTLRAISGIVRPSGGEIRFKGRPTGHMSSHQIVAGIGHVPKGRQLFAEMSVSDNLHVGAFRAQDVARRRDSVLEHFPRLRKRIGQQAGTLSGGEQQMLAIARVLMAEPDLLMFDEPSMGLSPIMVESVASIIRDLAGRGLTVLLVEQNASLALSVATRAYVPELGTVAVSGTTEEIPTSPSCSALTSGRGRTRDPPLSEVYPRTAADEGSRFLDSAPSRDPASPCRNMSTQGTKSMPCVAVIQKPKGPCRTRACSAPPRR